MDIIKKSTLRNDVSRKIRESIFSNELKPGERIVETKLAKELGVSQSPVREAIRELELMGIIESKPYLGTFVKKLTTKDIRDAYKVRTYLEMLAVSEAIKYITETDLEKMGELLKDMRTAAKNQSTSEFVKMDICFHRLIIKISDNHLLMKMWNIVNLGQWTSVTTKISGRSLLELASRHEALVESLKAKDAEKASKCIKLHIEELCEDIIKKMDSNS